MSLHRFSNDPSPQDIVTGMKPFPGHMVTEGSTLSQGPCQT